MFVFLTTNTYHRVGAVHSRIHVSRLCADSYVTSYFRFPNTASYRIGHNQNNREQRPQHFGDPLLPEVRLPRWARSGVSQSDINLDRPAPGVLTTIGHTTSARTCAVRPDACGIVAADERLICKDRPVGVLKSVRNAPVVRRNSSA